MVKPSENGKNIAETRPADSSLSPGGLLPADHPERAPTGRPDEGALSRLGHYSSGCNDIRIKQFSHTMGETGERGRRVKVDEGLGSALLV